MGISPQLTKDIGSITGRTAIVTGSSSGVGRAIALALASEGANIVCSDIRPDVKPGGYEQSTEPTHELINKNGKAVFQKTDVSSEDDVKALVKRAVEEYGRLDIMVNNAGIFCGVNRIHDEPVEAFDRSMAVNTRGVFLGMKFAVGQFLRQEPLPSGDRGWLVNIGSIGGLVGLAEEPSYCASKGAVVNLTRQVAVDYAKDRIHINVVCPGFLETSMVRPALMDKATAQRLFDESPWPHLGSSESVAKAVLFLSSDAAAFITGSVLNVDGGFCAR